MEKRRRERINHSLETLRLLMLESTQDEVRLCVMLQAWFMIDDLWQNVLTSNIRLLLCIFSEWFELSCLHLETEESEGGESRDSGECGEFPEDRQGGGEGSPGHEESPFQGAETELCPPTQLPWRHEVLSAEGQPLHSQQEPGVRRHRWGYGSGFSCASRAPDAPLLSHPQGTDARCCRWLCCSVSSASAPPSPPARDPSSIPYPDWHPLWHQGAALPHGSLHAHLWPCVEALASVTDTIILDMYCRYRQTV